MVDTGGEVAGNPVDYLRRGQAALELVRGREHGDPAVVRTHRLFSGCATSKAFARAAVSDRISMSLAMGRGSGDIGRM